MITLSKPSDDTVSIGENSLVKVTKMNHVIEVQHMEKMNRKNHIKKLDKDNFVDLRTGEIREFEHIENRKGSLNSLRQSFKKLRYLINNNFVGNPNELHIILTYKKNMTDTKQLYTDFDKFMKRLKYAYKDKSTIDYLTVVEPQERGAWHCHCLMRFNDLKSIYIPNKFDGKKRPIDAPLYELWGHGWVTIKSLKDVDNIGAYLSAYLTDVELSEENFQQACLEESEIKIKQVDGQDKKFIKGGRLHMYPPGMRIYRNSKGIVPPDREEMTYKNAKKIVGSAQPHYSKKYHIQNDDFENTITFIQYNTKRQK